MKSAGLPILADSAKALPRLARERAFERPAAQSDALILIAEAAPLAPTSVRHGVRDASRREDLATFRRMRDRAFRHADLPECDTSRALRPVKDTHGADTARAGTAPPSLDLQ